MNYRVRTCLKTPLSAACDLFAVTVHTSPVDLQKTLKESEKVQKYYKKKVETINKKLQIKEVNISVLLESLVREISESAIRKLHSKAPLDKKKGSS